MELVDEIRTIVGTDFVVTRRDRMEQYLRDETPQAVKPVPADNVIVVKPATAEQVSEVLKVANRTQTPVYPRGGGTSTVGGPIPTSDGIVLSLERLDRVVAIDTVRSCRVSPNHWTSLCLPHGWPTSWMRSNASPRSTAAAFPTTDMPRMGISILIS